VSSAPLILVVEDNPTNQLLATTVLERDGFETMVADSSDDALVCIRSRRPDLILMDVQLPGMDGLTFTRHLQSVPEAAGIPIIAMTSHAMVGDREKAMEAGCAGYMSKPVDTRTLGDDLRRYLLSAGRRPAA
jgi:CheY-like chemotaxis protein